jgi:hypothetical protein
MAKTFLQAADEILRAAEGPLTAREITERALARGVVTTHGITPDRTMLSKLYKAAASGRVQRVHEPGLKRARRGTVRWLPAD